MTTDLSAVLSSVLPILLLIVLGAVLGRTGLLDNGTVAGLKRLIVNVALPAVLFTTFLSTRFEAQHIALVAVVFALCIVLLGLGFGFRSLARGGRYQPYLFTGFELGMMGFALFAAGFGSEQLPALGVLALGHEVFIWFVFVSLLRSAGAQRQRASALVRELATSPTIIAIVLGLAANFVGLGPLISSGPIGGALMTTLKYLAAVIVPMVLLIVGQGVRLSRTGIRRALPLVLTRLALTVGLALLLGHWVTTGLGLDPIYAKALFTLLVLPPPFIVPLFIPDGHADDLDYTNNVLSLYSLATVAVFVTYVAVVG